MSAARDQSKGLGMLGTLLLAGGGILLWNSGKQSAKADVQDSILSEPEGWEKLKQENQKLYWQCLKELDL